MNKELKRLVGIITVLALVVTTIIPLQADADVVVPKTAYLYSENNTIQMSCIDDPNMPVPYVAVDEYFNNVYTIPFTVSKQGDGTYVIENGKGSMVLDPANDIVHVDEPEIFLYNNERYDTTSTVDRVYERTTHVENKSEPIGVDIDFKEFFGNNNIDVVKAEGDKVFMPLTTISDLAGVTYCNAVYADGKISFPGSTIQDGWVKWNVSFANTGNYNGTLNINSNNCKNYTVALVDANDANVVTPLTLNDCSTTGTPVALAMGAMEVPAGNYILKVTNATQNSDAELISVNFAYTGGGIIDIPGTIALNEAILSERAFIDGDGLHFVDAEHLWLMSEGYAKWNIHVAADGIYKFTANCNSSNYSNLTIQVLQGGEEKYTYTPEYSYSGEKTIVSPEWFFRNDDGFLMQGTWLFTHLIRVDPCKHGIHLQLRKQDLSSATLRRRKHELSPFKLTRTFQDPVEDTRVFVNKLP